MNRILIFTISCCVAATGCLGTGSAERPLSSREVLGQKTPTPLTLAAATVTSAVKISRADANRSVHHPFAAPQLAGPIQQFGLARVTASGLAVEGTGPIPVYRDKLAWVGVYEISKGGEHSCPGEPGPLPNNMPPVFRHYYFVVPIAQTLARA